MLHSSPRRLTARFRPWLEAFEDRQLLTCTINWINPDGGSWHEPGNWDRERVPQGGDDVCLDVGGTATITYSSGNSSIQSLTSAEAIDLTDGLLSFRTAEINGPFHMGGGRLALGGRDEAAIFNGLLRWSAGIITGGTMFIPGGLEVSGPARKELSGVTIVNTTTAVWIGQTSVTVHSGTFRNLEGALLDFQGDGGLSGLGPLSVSNAGVLRKSSGMGMAGIGGPALVDNSGTVEVASGTLSMGGGAGPLTGSGGFTVLPGAALALFASSCRFLDTSYFYSAGTLRFNCGATFPGFFQSTGATLLEGGAYTFTGEVVDLGALTVQTSGQVVLPRGTPLTLDSLTLIRGTLDSDADLTVAGPFTWTQGTLRGPGVTRAEGGLMIRGSGPKALENGRILHNGGAATFTGQGRFSTGADSAFHNLEGASFTTEGSTSFAGTFVNAGQLDIGGAGAAATFVMDGDYRQTKTGVLGLEIGSLDAGEFDVLAITGTAWLDGTLSVALLESFLARDEDGFPVLTCGACEGQFATLILPDLGDDFAFDPEYKKSGLTLRTRARR